MRRRVLQKIRSLTSPVFVIPRMPESNHLIVLAERTWIPAGVYPERVEGPVMTIGNFNARQERLNQSYLFKSNSGGTRPVPRLNSSVSSICGFMRPSA